MNKIMGRPKKNKLDEVLQLNKEEIVAKDDSVKGLYDDRICALYVSEDTPLQEGLLRIPVSMQAKNYTCALVVSTADNSIHGLLVENGKRLENSFVVSTSFVSNEKICVTLNVQDNTSILRQTPFGTRMDSLVLPKGTHVANLVFFNKYE